MFEERSGGRGSAGITRSSIRLQSEALLARVAVVFPNSRSRTISDLETLRVRAALAISANNSSGTLIVIVFIQATVLPIRQIGNTTFYHP